MIRKYFDRESLLALALILVGLFCSFIYTENIPSQLKTKTQPSLIFDLVMVGPFALGIVLGSRILSNDQKPEKEFWFNDHLFFTLSSLLMAISMFGLSMYLTSKEWFVISDRKSSHDVTTAILSFGGLLSCLVLYKISPRLFGSMESIFLPMASFLGLTYVFEEVNLPTMINYNGGIHVIALIIAYVNLKHTTAPKRYLFTISMFFAYIYYFVFL